MSPVPEVPSVPDSYLPRLIAWDLNFLPDPESFFEITDLGNDQIKVRLASFNVPSNIIVNYDQDWNQ